MIECHDEYTADSSRCYGTICVSSFPVLVRREELRGARPRHRLRDLVFLDITEPSVYLWLHALPWRGCYGVKTHYLSHWYTTPRKQILHSQRERSKPLHPSFKKCEEGCARTRTNMWDAWEIDGASKRTAYPAPVCKKKVGSRGPLPKD